MMPSAIGNDRSSAGSSASLSAGKKSFRPDIQGIRALAVLVVIADHLFHWPSGGFVGVDVFFVISGFLITGILLREYDKTEHISFIGFYSRRIRRIIPAATLVLIATTVAAYFLFTSGRFWETANDAFWAFVFLGNWHMALVGTDYFQLGLPPSPLQHYWSLSVEEQFYFVWPWMMLALLVIASKIGWSKPSRRKLILVTFVVATVASFAWSLYETSSNPTFAYFSTFSRAWELGVGAILAALVPLVSKLPSAIRPVLGWIGLLGILASVFFITSDLPFPGPWAVAPVLSTALLIAAGTGAQNASYNWAMIPLTNRVTTYVGDISYSLYLWHFPIIILLLAVLPASSPAYVVICLVGMFGLAILSYHFVENAFRAQTVKSEQSRRSSQRKKRRGRGGSRATGWQTIWLLASAVAAVTLVAIAINPRVPPIAEGQNATSSDQSAVVESEVEAALCRGADFMDPARAPGCDLSALGSALTPSVDDLKDDTGGAYQCYRGEDEAIQTCNYGSESGDAVRVALVGDSHAAMLIPGLLPSLDGLNWSLDTYVGNGCQWKLPLKGNCVAAMDEIRAKMAVDPYDLVITTGARWVGGDTTEAAQAYATAWSEAQALGSQIVVIADVPGVSDEALACIARVGFNASDNDCGTEQGAALSQPDPLLEATSLVPGAKLVDLTSYYCANGFCPSVIGNTQVYRDTASHITASYMKTMQPYLIAEVTAALGV